MTLDYPAHGVHLTRREQQVVGGVARGLRNHEIARELGISCQTVKKHLTAIYGKLAVRGRLELALRILRAESRGQEPEVGAPCTLHSAL